MPVRIRLQRHGKKGKPFYWIVAADGRAKRDGRYLEKIGTYNPNTNPATVELDIDQAVKWLENGAQPSDTARTLLSYRGAMIKHHLNGGVKKGAFSQEEADKRFADWLKEKQAKVQAKIDSLDKDKATDLAQRLEAEKAVNQKRIAELIADPKPEEAPKEEAPEKIPSIEESKAEDAPSEEAKSENAPAEEAKSENAPPEETKNENAPPEEAKNEDAPPVEAKNEDAAEEIQSVEESKAEDAHAEEAKSENAPPEEAKNEDAPAEEEKSDDPPSEEEETK